MIRKERKKYSMRRKKRKEAQLAVLLYGFLFAYVLSFIFEGKVYFKMIGYFADGQSLHPFVGMIFHMVGLLIAGKFVTSKRNRVMQWNIFACVLFTPFFLFENNIVRALVFCSVSFFSGIAVACWGRYYKYSIATESRMKAMADSLIVANVLMIIASVIATFVSAVIGFFISILYLVISLLILRKIDMKEQLTECKRERVSVNEKEHVFFHSSMILLVTFIIIITINSGLMYGVFNHTFESFERLISWYWTVPYILALVVLRITVKKRNSSFYIYLAIMMIVAGFVLFIFMDVSMLDYVIIDSLLLIAAGILDLFWSSTVGEIFEYTKNPIRILSIGWSANVCGVLIGVIISDTIIRMFLPRTMVAVIALVVTCVSLVILPLLLERLRGELKNHLFVSSINNEIIQKQNACQEMYIHNLTNREREILALVIQGKTNKIIASDLFISENTVKTHVRSILAKYEVENRTQLISKLMNEQMKMAKI